MVVVNVSRFPLDVEAVDVAVELIQDITMAEDMSFQSLDKDVAVVPDVDVEVDSQDVVQVDVLDFAIVKPVRCSKTLAVLLDPDVRHAMDKPTCWTKALDEVPETKMWIKADAMTTCWNVQLSLDHSILFSRASVLSHSESQGSHGSQPSLTVYFS